MFYGTYGLNKNHERHPNRKPKFMSSKNLEIWQDLPGNCKTFRFRLEHRFPACVYFFWQPPKTPKPRLATEAKDEGATLAVAQNRAGASHAPAIAPTR